MPILATWLAQLGKHDTLKHVCLPDPFLGTEYSYQNLPDKPREAYSCPSCPLVCPLGQLSPSSALRDFIHNQDNDHEQWQGYKLDVK